ncbi:MAG TPA: hypothetical protein VNU66_11540, partial [Mycobacteriales bacterium]|nr:hypothetical protein [Mycobacteriales bacterium]
MRGTRAPATAWQLRAVVVVLAVLSVVSAVVWAWWLLQQPPVPTWQLALLVLVPVGELSLLHLRYGSHQLTFTWGEVSVLIGLALAGPGWLVLVSLPGILVVHLFLGGGWLKAVCNGAVFSLAASAAGVLVLALGHPPYRISDLTSALILLAASAVWTAVSVVLTTGVIAFAQGARASRMLWESAGVFLLVWAGNVLIGGAVLLLAERDPRTLLGMPPLLALLYAVYRGYLSARQESDVWRQLEAATRELNDLDERAVARAALQRAAQLFRADGAELVVRTPERPWRRYRLDADGALQVQDATAAPDAGTTSYLELTPDGRMTPLSTWLTSPLEGPQGRIGELRLLFGGSVRLSRRERQ